jgi:hypothetical protein
VAEVLWGLGEGSGLTQFSRGLFLLILIKTIVPNKAVDPLQTQTSKQPMGEISRYGIIPSIPLKCFRSKQGFKIFVGFLIQRYS